MQRSGDHSKSYASYSRAASRENSPDRSDSNRSPRAIEQQTALGSSSTPEPSPDLLVRLIEADKPAALEEICQLATKSGKGDVLNEVDSKGQAPLVRALATSNFAAVQILAKYGAKPTAQSQYLISLNRGRSGDLQIDQIALCAEIKGRATSYLNYERKRLKINPLVVDIKERATQLKASIAELKAMKDARVMSHAGTIDRLNQFDEQLTEISNQAREALETDQSRTFFCYSPYSRFFEPQLENLDNLFDSFPQSRSSLKEAATLNAIFDQDGKLREHCEGLETHCVGAGRQHMAGANFPELIASFYPSVCLGAGRNAITFCVAQNDLEAFAALKAAYGSEGDEAAWRFALDAVDGNGSTPLTLACENNNLEFVRELIDAGASPSACDSRFVNPFSAADRHSGPEMIKFLLKCNVPLPYKLSRIGDLANPAISRAECYGFIQEEILGALRQAQNHEDWYAAAGIVSALHGLKLSAASEEGDWIEDCRAHLYPGNRPEPEVGPSLANEFARTEYGAGRRGAIVWLCDCEVEKALSGNDRLVFDTAAAAVHRELKEIRQDELEYGQATLSLLSCIRAARDCIRQKSYRGNKARLQALERFIPMLDWLSVSRIAAHPRCQALIQEARAVFEKKN